MSVHHAKKLIALPTQVVELSDGLVLKRGATELAIRGSNAAQAIKLLLHATRSEGASLDELKRLFNKRDAGQVKALIYNLVDRHILVAADNNSGLDDIRESPLDVFFWNFNHPSTRVVERFCRVRLVIIGVNFIARQLVQSLISCGHRNHVVLDDPRHRNNLFFHGDGRMRKKEWPQSFKRPQPYKTGQYQLGDCFIATSDFGAQESFREWNKVCLDNKATFLPVMLKNFIGYVGPSVFPGETPCFECFLSRQRSHSTQPHLQDIMESVAFDGQKVMGYHPSMTTVLGDIAAFEITRMFSESLPKREPGELLEVDLVAGKMIGRTVLKVPRCGACSPLHKTSLTNIKKVLFPEDTRAQ